MQSWFRRRCKSGCAGRQWWAKSGAQRVTMSQGRGLPLPSPLLSWAENPAVHSSETKSCVLYQFSAVNVPRDQVRVLVNKKREVRWKCIPPGGPGPAGGLSGSQGLSGWSEPGVAGCPALREAQESAFSWAPGCGWNCPSRGRVLITTGFCDLEETLRHPFAWSPTSD